MSRLRWKVEERKLRRKVWERRSWKRVEPSVETLDQTMERKSANSKRANGINVSDHFVLFPSRL